MIRAGVTTVNTRQVTSLQEAHYGTACSRGNLICATYIQAQKYHYGIHTSCSCQCHATEQFT